jgi:hypothetical protein
LPPKLVYALGVFAGSGVDPDLLALFDEERHGE